MLSVFLSAPQNRKKIQRFLQFCYKNLRSISRFVEFHALTEACFRAIIKRNHKIEIRKVGLLLWQSLQHHMPPTEKACDPHTSQKPANHRLVITGIVRLSHPERLRCLCSLP